MKPKILTIQTAKYEAYSNPKLFIEYNKQTIEKYHYSKIEEKDIKVWEVHLVTDDRSREDGMLADLIYYINTKNGDIVDKISGVD